MSEVQTIQLQQCRDCGREWQSVLAGCPYCGSGDVAFTTEQCRGAVYSWIEVHRSFTDTPETVPFTILTVELERGARVFGRYGPGGSPESGERVAATGMLPSGAFVFQPVTPGTTG